MIITAVRVAVAWLESHKAPVQNQTYSFDSYSLTSLGCTHNKHTIHANIHTCNTYTLPLHLPACTECLLHQNHTTSVDRLLGCYGGKVSVSRVTYHSKQSLLWGYVWGLRFCTHALSISHHASLGACMCAAP